jgi:hypothetical protein
MHIRLCMYRVRACRTADYIRGGGAGGGAAGRTEAAYTYSACVYRDYGSFVCYTITNTENGRTADMRKYYNYYEIKGINTDDSGWDYISLFTK